MNRLGTDLPVRWADATIRPETARAVEELLGSLVMRARRAVALGAGARPGERPAGGRPLVEVERLARLSRRRWLGQPAGWTCGDEAPWTLPETLTPAAALHAAREELMHLEREAAEARRLVEDTPHAYRDSILWRLHTLATRSAAAQRELSPARGRRRWEARPGRQGGALATTQAGG